VAVTELQTMIVVLACGAGAILTAALAAQIIAVRRARHWQATFGRVVASAVEARATVRPGIAAEKVVGNYPRIVYEYEVEGRRHQSHRLTFARESPNRAIAATLARYPVGAEVTVYYDPTRPSEAVLERAAGGFAVGVGSTWAVVAGIVAASIFGLDHLLALVDRLLPNADSPQIVVLIGGLALLTALAGLLWLRQAGQQHRWPTATGTVVSSSVEPYKVLQQGGSSGATMTLYRPAVVYGYEVDGRRYESNQITPGEAFGSSAPEPAERTVRRYPVGRAITPRYNPRNPAESVLEIGWGGAFVLWLLAAVFAALAVSVSGYFRRS
jgi:hypothetical protein